MNPRTLSEPGYQEDIVLTALRLLQAGSRLARQTNQPKEDCISFYAIKDDVMNILHRTLGHTDAVSYSIIPFMIRCPRCKRKADVLHQIEPSRSWEYYLNILPQCESDVEKKDKTTIEQTVRWKGEIFFFHIPLAKTIRWGLNTKTIAKRFWVPEEDYSRSKIPETNMTLAETNARLIPILGRLVDSIELFIRSSESASGAAQPAPMKTPKYDVFISHKSKDFSLAKRVYDTLADQGKKVFLSEISLPEMGDADFRRAIEAALESSLHMVVVASTTKDAFEPWMEFEWGAFLKEKLSGRKKGNIVSLIAQGCNIAELPLCLRVNEVIELTDEGLKKLCAYLWEERG